MSGRCKPPNKIDFLCMSPSEIKRILYPKDQSNLIERGKKKIWSIKHRHRKRDLAKPKRYPNLSKRWRMLTKRFSNKSGLIKIFQLQRIFTGYFQILVEYLIFSM